MVDLSVEVKTNFGSSSVAGHLDQLGFSVFVDRLERNVVSVERLFRKGSRLKALAFLNGLNSRDHAKSGFHLACSVALRYVAIIQSKPVEVNLNVAAKQSTHTDDHNHTHDTRGLRGRTRAIPQCCYRITGLAKTQIA